MTEIIMVAAIFFGPIIAVQLTRYLDNKKEIRDRKLQIFKTLMATRSNVVSLQHVEALNRIDLEFDNKKAKEKAVVEAWKEYHDLLGDRKTTFELWNAKRVDLLIELLHKMAMVLDYEFDKTHIKNSSYTPVAHEDAEFQLTAIRQGIVDLLEGKITFPMEIAKITANQPEPSKEIEDSDGDLLDSKE